MKLILGSAAWRVPYGSFSKGLLTDKQIDDLTTQAALLGFEVIDTAPTYGDVEDVLGNINPKQYLATKVTVDPYDYSSITKSIDLSRKKLGVQSLDLVFVHNWDVLSETEKYDSAEVLQACILNQTIKNWGFSTYEVTEIMKLKKYGWSHLKVQINANILDQRILEVDSLVKSDDFEKLNTEIWVRSVFLQGVLLDESSKNPFMNHQDIVNFFSFCKRVNVSPIEMCLAYIRKLEFIDGVLIGIENAIQLDEIARAFRVEIPQINFKELESKDLQLIDPRKWNLNK
jgi:aryl-alcohol dehydrogenase-like predicted oxidoreductase